MNIFQNDSYSHDEMAFIKSEHRKAYFKLFRSTVLVQAVFPLVLCYVFYSRVSSTIIFSWLATILLVTVIRGYLTYGWYKLDVDAAKTRLFEILSLSLSLVAGCLWGLTILIVDFKAYPEASVFLNMIVFGLSAGSLGIGSYWLEYFFIYNIPVFIIYTLGYIFGLPEPSYLLAVLIMFFLVLMIQIAMSFHRSNAQNISLSKRNEKLAKSLNYQKQEAEKFGASRTRLLASASHDLRQPLQALNFFLSAIHPELHSNKGREIYSKLEKCTENINELLSSMLDVSKLDAQVVTLNKEAVCMNSLLRELKQQFQMQADNKSLVLIFDACDQYVYSDAVLLRRVLSNLIINAISYTKCGNVEVRVNQDEGLLIEIIDTGPGLSEQEQEYIFEEFYQLDNPERDKSKGLGLGLSIVKRLCLLMDIPMGLSSQKGRGSRFSLLLPICDAPSAVTEPSQLEARTITEGKKILVIDDEAAIRDSLAGLLSQWQCQVAAAESADEACQIIERDGYYPDLVITDYRLREHKTGVEAIKQVKKLMGNEQLPAIIISGDTEPSRLKEAASSGYELLHKPVKPAQLRMLIQRKLMP